jgi:hypothetical protein
MNFVGALASIQGYVIPDVIEVRDTSTTTGCSVEQSIKRNVIIEFYILTLLTHNIRDFALHIILTLTAVSIR